MADQRLNIIFSGDASQLTKTIDQLENELKGFQSQLKGNLGATEFNRLNQSIAQTKAQILSMRSASAAAGGALKSISPGANQATQSMINLGRVVQDAPFGFLGIANNLNPLLESFQRLKASTGTTGGALKALGSSLLGAGGLGFALSVVSSLLIVFGDNIFGAGKKAKAANEEFDRVKDVIKDLSGTLAERSSVAAAGASAELAKVSILVGVIQDQTKSYTERNNALTSLKSINKSYFGDLTLEAASLATLTGKVNEYSQALINAEIFKAFAADIAKTDVETAKALNTFNKLGNEIDNINRKLKETPKLVDKQNLRGDIVQQSNVAYEKLTKRLGEANKEYSIQVGLVGELTTATLVSREGLKKGLEEGLKFKPLETPTGAGGSGEKAIDKLIAKARQFVKEFGDVLVLPDLSETFFTNRADLVKTIEKLFADIKLGKFTLKIPVDVSIVPALLPVKEITENDPSKQFFETLKKDFEKGGEIDFSIPVKGAIKSIDEAIKGFASLGDAGVREFIRINKAGGDLGEGLEAFKKRINESIFAANLLGEALGGAFDSMLEALFEGGNGLKGFFDGLADSVKRLIARLLTAVVVAGILSALTGGASGVLGGFGKIFKGLIGLGGGIASPTNFGSGRSQAFGSSLVATVRGTDLAFVLQQGQNSIGRVG